MRRRRCRLALFSLFNFSSCKHRLPLMPCFGHATNDPEVCRTTPHKYPTLYHAFSLSPSLSLPSSLRYRIVTWRRIKRHHICLYLLDRRCVSVFSQHLAPPLPPLPHPHCHSLLGTCRAVCAAQGFFFFGPFRMSIRLLRLRLFLRGSKGTSCSTLFVFCFPPSFCPVCSLSGFFFFFPSLFAAVLLHLNPRRYYAWVSFHTWGGRERMDRQADRQAGRQPCTYVGGSGCSRRKKDRRKRQSVLKWMHGREGNKRGEIGRAHV